LLNPEGRDLLPPRPEWRREDDAPANPGDAAEAHAGPRFRPRSRRARGPGGDPAAHRGRAAGSPAADAPLPLRSHPLLLPDPRPIADAGPRTDQESHGRPRTLGAPRQARVRPFRRPASAADHRDGDGGGPGGPVLG